MCTVYHSAVRGEVVGALPVSEGDDLLAGTSFYSLDSRHFKTDKKGCEQLCNCIYTQRQVYDVRIS